MVVKPSIVLILLSLLTLVVDLLSSYSIESVTITILVIVLFFGYIDSDLEQRYRELSISFIVISTVLCMEMLVFREEFTYSLSVGAKDFDRIGWNDPNYFSGLIGMGALTATSIIIFNKELSKILRYLLFLVVLLVIVVSFMVASRGGIVALFAGILTLVVLSRKHHNKFASRLFLLLLVSVSILYSMGFMDLLFSRFNNDVGEIGGRRIIWFGKLSDFAGMASPIDWLIGIGRRKGFSLSSNLGNQNVMGFHNDYLAFLLCYGILGLFLLLTLLIYPILKFKDARVTAGVVYLMLISWSLEPLSSGMLDFFYYYFFLCIMGAEKEYRTKKNRQICEFKY